MRKFKKASMFSEVELAEAIYRGELEIIEVINESRKDEINDYNYYTSRMNDTKGDASKSENVAKIIIKDNCLVRFSNWIKNTF